ncbi:MAG: DUF5652 family protein [Candidatus Uhrbacteria bacterium]
MSNTYALVLISLWTMPWKGYALWKAARRQDRNWFIAILVLQTLAILDILYIFVFSREETHDTGTDNNHAA